MRCVVPYLGAISRSGRNDGELLALLEWNRDASSVRLWIAQIKLEMCPIIGARFGLGSIAMRRRVLHLSDIATLVIMTT